MEVVLTFSVDVVTSGMDGLDAYPYPCVGKEEVVSGGKCTEPGATEFEYVDSGLLDDAE